MSSIGPTSPGASRAITADSARVECAAPIIDAADHGLLRQHDAHGLEDWATLPGAGDWAKRVFDVVCALSMIVVLAPLLLLIAVMVMLDGGPCVFGHTRIGMNGVKFRCLKFRSMVTNADEVLRELLERDPVARAEWERDFKLKDDVRITRLGRFIRSTSLDELPQLWNVVRGEMSLVGPRPIVEAELERYGAYTSYYLMTKPGITGMWQVSGRSDLDYASRVSLDVQYAKTRSFGGDALIMFKTIGVALKRRGAY
ncbi:sugar transferase [Burkholderia sp. JP2-270]|nr:sugar transferase [Burkholderia sp. JP2-270]